LHQHEGIGVGCGKDGAERLLAAVDRAAEVGMAASWHHFHFKK